MTPPAWLLRMDRAMELLWLLAAFLVPLIFVSPGYMVSEASIGFVEIPKITLLRTVVALMVILGSAKWALSARFDKATDLRSATSRVVSWLREEPGRWVVATVLALMAVTVLSTLLSAAPRVSFWGEVEAQDGYSAYTMISYMVLFLFVATQVRSRAQVMRLAGAIAASGSLVGLVAIVQVYDLEPFSFLELTQPSDFRPTSTLGNPMFAGAVLLMTVPVTLATALVATRRHWSILRMSPWVIALVAQLLGITFTLARGPWVGLAFALGVILALGWYVLGRAHAARAAAILASALALSLVVVYLPSQRAVLDFASGGSDGAGPSHASSDVDVIAARVGTLSPEAIGGNLRTRTPIWKSSAKLMISHPWFEFESLSFAYLRPLIGYGPDLFRYAFLLESRPFGESRTPLEADNAHNLFIHQTVELGFLGLASWLALFGATFVVGAVHLMRHRHDTTPGLLWIMIGIYGAMAGRLLEQMVGVGRVGDLTLFWVLLGLLVALPRAIREMPPAQNAPRSSRRISLRPYNLGLLVAAASLAVGLGWLTWAENINYARAAVEMGYASSDLDEDRAADSLRHIDRAVRLAPHMGPYYTFKAQALESFRQDAQTRDQAAMLAEQAYLSALDGQSRDPLSFRSRRTLADSALKLATLARGGKDFGYEGKDVEAITLFTETTQMVPWSWILYNHLAGAHLTLGQPKEALPVLEKSISISGGTSPASAQAWFFKGVAHGWLGEAEEAISALQNSLRLDNTGQQAAQAHQQLADTYASLGQSKLAQQHHAQAQTLTAP